MCKMLYRARGAMGSVKGTTKSQGNKQEFDKFYTKPEIVDQCLNYLDLTKFDCIIEPSAGGGAFSNKIPRVFAFDLVPENENIQQADWLKLDKTQFEQYKNILVIGNPPFGNNGKLAKKFLVESMKFADTVAFVLPKSFKKNSVKNRLPLDFVTILEIDLPVNSFTLNDNDYSVPCVFQVWQKTESMREKVVMKNKSALIDFTTIDKADFRIQRVGGRAGKASLNLDVSVNSNYFVKNNSGMSNEELIEMINSLVFPSINDTAGPRSLPKGELISVLEKTVLEKM